VDFQDGNAVNIFDAGSSSTKLSQRGRTSRSRTKSSSGPQQIVLRLRRSPPRWDNFVELDPSVKDIYGIPVLKIHMSDGENERAMIQDMGDSAGEMLERRGKKYSHLRPSSAPRWALHEAGIARMGADQKKSVLNQFQQTPTSRIFRHGRLASPPIPARIPRSHHGSLCPFL